MGLSDVHAHLTNRRLLARFDEVVRNARQAGVTTVVANGLHPADNELVRELSRRDPLVKPAFGLYPVDAVLPEMIAMGVDYERPDTDPIPAEDAIRWVADHVGEAVAVGEIGLDRHWVPEALWERQEAVFRELIRVARDADKPIIVHSRKAEARMFEVLKEEGVARVDWHCFGGKSKLGLRIGAHGHWLSIPANARRSEGFAKLLRELPRDKVLLETDCPYLGPEKGVLNEPANVAGTAAFAAEVWGWTPEAVEAQLEANFEALFGFRP